MKLKDLKTTYNVLDEIDFDLPKEVFVFLADKIREKEHEMNERKMSRMSEEELIEHQNKPRRTFSITTDDGRYIQKRTNEATFRRAMAELDEEKVAALNLTIGKKPLVVFDKVKKRQRLKGYACIRPGYFVLAKSTMEDKIRNLLIIDKRLRLNWEI